jgi:hypothetical protein
MCIWCASLLSQICQGNVANYCALSAKEARYRLFRFEFAAHMDLITHWAVQLNFVPQSIIIQNLRVKRLIKMVLHYLVKSAIFEGAVFAIASIVGYLVVYRWLPANKECIE